MQLNERRKKTTKSEMHEGTIWVKENHAGHKTMENDNWKMRNGIWKMSNGMPPFNL
jgi:hypothetical protein